MRSSLDPPSIVRPAGVISGVVLALGGSLWALATVLRATTTVILGPGRASVDELVTATSAAAAVLMLVWVSLGLLVSVLAAIPGPWGALSGRVRDYLAPVAVRRWAALLLGAAIATSLAPAGAAATVQASASAPAAPAPGWDALDQADPVDTPAPAPAWTPAPVRDLPPVSLTAPRQAADSTDQQVTVRRGDTLWDLAAAQLPGEATDAEIAAAWQQWYAANREVIGPDPDLILPGQVLTAPSHTSPRAEVFR